MRGLTYTMMMAPVVRAEFRICGWVMRMRVGDRRTRTAAISRQSGGTTLQRRRHR